MKCKVMTASNRWCTVHLLVYVFITFFRPRCLISLQIMEQVEGGDLIVNRGDESRPKKSHTEDGRDFNSVEGYEAASKLAQVSGSTLSAYAPPDLSPTNRPISMNLSRTVLRLRPTQNLLQYNPQLHTPMFIFECSLSS